MTMNARGLLPQAVYASPSSAAHKRVGGNEKIDSPYTLRSPHVP